MAYYERQDSLKKKDIHDLILTLENGLERAADGSLPDHEGICGFAAFSSRPKDVKIALRRAFKSWPKWSGDLVYPVPSSSPMLGMDAEEAFDFFAARGEMWTGEYGALRIELLSHCIEFLKREYEAIAA